MVWTKRLALLLHSPLLKSGGNCPLLGRHGSVSLCRDGQDSKMAATIHVFTFKRRYFTWWQILRVQRHLDLLSDVAPTLQ